MLTRTINVLLHPYQATEFVELLGGQKSVYGYHCDSLKSLLISLLPPSGFQIEDKFKPDSKDGPSIEVSLMEGLLNGLRDSAGFRIPVVSAIDDFTFCINVFYCLECSMAFVNPRCPWAARVIVIIPSVCLSATMHNMVAKMQYQRLQCYTGLILKMAIFVKVLC